MKLQQLVNESPFVTALQSESFIDLLQKCTMGSSRDITKYLATPKEDLTRNFLMLGDQIKQKDPDVANGLRDIVQDLQTDGHIGQVSKINLQQLFTTIDRVIRSKRETN